MQGNAVLQVNGLQVGFPRPDGAGEMPVVRDLQLTIEPGRILGLVGESGSGKSMTALALMGLIPQPGRVRGSILLEGRELVGLSEAIYETIRGGSISIVFQDPSTALNPVLSIGEQLLETVLRHRMVTEVEARQICLESLRQVEIPSPEDRLRDYPHQLSGGMKQRVLIAMALLCEPCCLLLDEPTTALDVTVQSQILDLIELIQNSKRMGILLISHDLGVVAEVADEIAVIYAGRIVEQSTTAAILASPRHPYTAGLLHSIPVLGTLRKPLEGIAGFPPNPTDLPTGCPFHPRCSRALERCQTDDPPYTVNGPGKFACWNPEAV